MRDIPAPASSSTDDSDLSFESAPGDLDACSRSPDALRRNLASDLCRTPEWGEGPEEPLAPPIFFNDLPLAGVVAPEDRLMAAQPEPEPEPEPEPQPAEPNHYTQLCPAKGEAATDGDTSLDKWEMVSPAATSSGGMRSRPDGGGDSSDDAAKQALANRESRVQARAQELAAAGGPNSGVLLSFFTRMGAFD